MRVVDAVVDERYIPFNVALVKAMELCLRSEWIYLEFDKPDSSNPFDVFQDLAGAHAPFRQSDMDNDWNNFATEVMTAGTAWWWRS